MGDTQCMIQTVDIARHDSYADCFYHLSANLSGGCHYTHLESGRNNRYDRIFVQISDLVDKYFQDHCTITTIYRLTFCTVKLFSSVKVSKFMVTFTTWWENTCHNELCRSYSMNFSNYFQDLVVNRVLLREQTSKTK